MKKRSAFPKGGNDCIMTPDSLALAIVKHFKPRRECLEPCSGDGAFVRALKTRKSVRFIQEYELSAGCDFLAATPPKSDIEAFPWLITNPPWSKFLAFLRHSMLFADNIVFLSYANAWFVKSRINAMREAGFHFREFAYVANPKKPWPQMGLQLAAVHISRKAGTCKFSHIAWTPES